MGGGGGLVGNITRVLTGGSGEGPESTGPRSVSDLAGGLQDQSNEIWSGMGATPEDRVKRQQEFASQLYGQAMGKTPSLAQAQLQAAMDRNLAQQVAAAKANRAVNPALAQRQLMNAAGQQQQQTAQAGALAAMQERQQAQNQFANYLGQQQQAAANTRAAAMGGAGSAANIDAFNASRGDKYFGSILQGASQGATMAAMSDKNLKKNVKPVKMAQGGVVQVIPDIAGGQLPQDTGNNQTLSSGIAGMFQKSGGTGSTMMAGEPTSFSNAQAAGTMMASSGGKVPGKAKVSGDSEQNDTVPAMLSPGELVIPRTVAQQGPDAVKSFAQALYQGGYVKKMSAGGVVEPLNLDKLKAYEYEYKDPKFGQGKQMSVMAQDMEKAGPAGKQMVVDTPEGKMIDYGKGFGAIVAAQAQLNERLNSIEQKYGKKK